MENKNLLSEMCEIAKIGGWEFYPESRRLIWSDEVFHIHEVPVGKMPSVEEALNFYTPESLPIITEAFVNAIHKGEPYALELQIRTAKGNLRHVRAIGKTHQENGSVIKVLGAFQDISQQKELEQKLFESQNEFKRIFNLYPDIVGYGSLEGRFTKINHALFLQLGYTEEEFLYKSFLDFVHPDDIAVTTEALQQALKGVTRIKVVNRYRSKDGIYKWISWSVAANAKALR